MGRGDDQLRCARLEVSIDPEAVFVRVSSVQEEVMGTDEKEWAREDRGFDTDWRQLVSKFGRLASFAACAPGPQYNRQ
jgi:hypothetical protein